MGYGATGKNEMSFCSFRLTVRSHFSTAICAPYVQVNLCICAVHVKVHIQFLNSGLTRGCCCKNMGFSTQVYLQHKDPHNYVQRAHRAQLGRVVFWYTSTAFLYPLHGRRFSTMVALDEFPSLALMTNDTVHPSNLRV
eukprot:COSAG02_NODE_5531_length_4252_cov_2.279316_4_plen_138_part_00